MVDLVLLEEYVGNGQKWSHIIENMHFYARGKENGEDLKKLGR
jgi:hypothetical protein